MILKGLHNSKESYSCVVVTQHARAMLWEQFQVEARAIRTQETATVNVWLPEGIVTSVWWVFCLLYESINWSLSSRSVSCFILKI